jgi:hypothetical protein
MESESKSQNGAVCLGSPPADYVFMPTYKIVPLVPSRDKIKSVKKLNK